MLGFAVAEVMFQLAPIVPSAGRTSPSSPTTLAPPIAEDPPAWTVVPSLAVEVISPTNTADDVERSCRTTSPLACDWSG